MRKSWSQYFPSLPDHERPSFKVYIHKGELDRIRQWVLKFPHTETGGDLFGLWKNGNELAIHYVLGPGKGCQRSGTSFRQNMEYFETVGQHIVDKHHLCHVGDWHSHHQLDIPHPSDGDEHSVWSNLPEYGFKRFIAFIARIVQLPCGRATRHVNVVGLGCFLFELKNSSYEQHQPVLQGEFKTVKYPYESPFREDPNIEWRAKQGQEFYPTCRNVNLENGSIDKTAWIIDQEEELLLPDWKHRLKQRLETTADSGEVRNGGVSKDSSTTIISYADTKYKFFLDSERQQQPRLQKEKIRVHLRGMAQTPEVGLVRLCPDLNIDSGQIQTVDQGYAGALGQFPPQSSISQSYSWTTPFNPPLFVCGQSQQLQVEMVQPYIPSQQTTNINPTFTAVKQEESLEQKTELTDTEEKVVVQQRRDPTTLLTFQSVGDSTLHNGTTQERKTGQNKVSWTNESNDLQSVVKSLEFPGSQLADPLVSTNVSVREGQTHQYSQPVVLTHNAAVNQEHQLANARSLMRDVLVAAVAPEQSLLEPVEVAHNKTVSQELPLSKPAELVQAMPVVQEEQLAPTAVPIQNMVVLPSQIHELPNSKLVVPAKLVTGGQETEHSAHNVTVVQQQLVKNGLPDRQALLQQRHVVEHQREDLSTQPTFLSAMNSALHNGASQEARTDWTADRQSEADLRNQIKDLQTVVKELMDSLCKQLADSQGPTNVTVLEDQKHPYLRLAVFSHSVAVGQQHQLVHARLLTRDVIVAVGQEQSLPEPKELVYNKTVGQELPFPEPLELIQDMTDQFIPTAVPIEGMTVPLRQEHEPTKLVVPSKVMAVGPENQSQDSLRNMTVIPELLEENGLSDRQALLQPTIQRMDQGQGETSGWFQTHSIISQRPPIDGAHQSNVVCLPSKLTASGTNGFALHPKSTNGQYQHTFYSSEAETGIGTNEHRRGVASVTTERLVYPTEIPTSNKQRTSRWNSGSKDKLDRRARAERSCELVKKSTYSHERGNAAHTERVGRTPPSVYKRGSAERLKTSMPTARCIDPQCSSGLTRSSSTYRFTNKRYGSSIGAKTVASNANGTGPQQGSGLRTTTSRASQTSLGHDGSPRRFTHLYSITHTGQDSTTKSGTSASKLEASGTHRTYDSGSKTLAPRSSTQHHSGLETINREGFAVQTGNLSRTHHSKSQPKLSRIPLPVAHSKQYQSDVSMVGANQSNTILFSAKSTVTGTNSLALHLTSANQYQPILYSSGAEETFGTGTRTNEGSPGVGSATTGGPVYLTDEQRTSQWANLRNKNRLDGNCELVKQPSSKIPIGIVTTANYINTQCGSGSRRSANTCKVTDKGFDSSSGSKGVASRANGTDSQQDSGSKTATLRASSALSNCLLRSAHINSITHTAHDSTTKSRTLASKLSATCQTHDSQSRKSISKPNTQYSGPGTIGKEGFARQACTVQRPHHSESGLKPSRRPLSVSNPKQHLPDATLNGAHRSNTIPSFSRLTAPGTNGSALHSKSTNSEYQTTLCNKTERMFETGTRINGHRRRVGSGTTEGPVKATNMTTSNEQFTLPWDNPRIRSKNKLDCRSEPRGGKFDEACRISTGRFYNCDSARRRCMVTDKQCGSSSKSRTDAFRANGTGSQQDSGSRSIISIPTRRSSRHDLCLRGSVGTDNIHTGLGSTTASKLKVGGTWQTNGSWSRPLAPKLTTQRNGGLRKSTCESGTRTQFAKQHSNAELLSAERKYGPSNRKNAGSTCQECPTNEAEDLGIAEQLFKGRPETARVHSPTEQTVNFSPEKV